MTDTSAGILKGSYRLPYYRKSTPKQLGLPNVVPKQLLNISEC